MWKHDWGFSSDPCRYAYKLMGVYYQKASSLASFFKALQKALGCLLTSAFCLWARGQYVKEWSGKTAWRRVF